MKEEQYDEDEEYLEEWMTNISKRLELLETNVELIRIVIEKDHNKKINDVLNETRDEKKDLEKAKELIFKGKGNKDND